MQHCEFPLVGMRSHVWNDIIFLNVSEAAQVFELDAADLMARWGEFDQALYHGGADSSLFLPLECNCKLAVENYCEAYQPPIT